MAQTHTIDGLTFATLKELRTLRGWTQHALAATLHVTVETIVNWELGHYRPQLRFRRELARVLEVPMAVLNDLLGVHARCAGAA